MKKGYFFSLPKRFFNFFYGKFFNAKNRFFSRVLFLKYIVLNTLSKKRVASEANIVVSLTTYHKRIDSVFLTIESIFHQCSKSEFEVRLYLCYEDLPKGVNGYPELNRLIKRGLKLILVTENIKSYKKLYYSSVENDSKIIVTADDDVFYPTWWLDVLLQYHRKNSNCVVAYRGHSILFDSNGSIMPYKKFMQSSVTSKGNHDSSYLLIPTGVSGVLYPVGSIIGLSEDKNLFTELSPSADDVWFKMRTILNSHKSVLVFGKNRDFTLLPSSQDDSLTAINVTENHNDQQIKNCLNYFPEIKNILWSEFNSKD